MRDKLSSDSKPSKALEEHLTRASELEAEGRISEAVAELETAAKDAVDKVSIYRKLSHLYRIQWQPDKAMAAARKAVKLHYADVEARELILDLLLELGKFDDVITEAKELLRISPRSLSARDTLSIAYLQKGMLEKALQITNELITLDPTSPVNHFKKAVLYQQKGDMGSAIHEFSRVLEMHPDSDMAREAQQAIDTLDAHQLRHIIMLAVEDYIFRAKLIHNPEAAALERGYYLSYTGMSALKQIEFDDLPDVYTEWKQRYYH